jgi:hypothetical protein
MRLRTGSNTIVTASTPLSVDDHGLPTIHQTLFHKKLQQPGFDSVLAGIERCIQYRLPKLISRSSQRLWQVILADIWKDMLAHNCLGDVQCIHVADRPQRFLKRQRSLLGVLAIVDNLAQAKNLAFPEIGQRAVAGALSLAQWCKSTTNNPYSMGIGSLLGNQWLRFN